MNRVFLRNVCQLKWSRSSWGRCRTTTLASRAAGVGQKPFVGCITWCHPLSTCEELPDTAFLILFSRLAYEAFKMLRSAMQSYTTFFRCRIGRSATPFGVGRTTPWQPRWFDPRTRQNVGTSTLSIGSLPRHIFVWDCSFHSWTFETMNFTRSWRYI